MPTTVKQGCYPRPGVFDPARRDTVLHLGDLVADRIDPAEFFAENYITEGMRTLLTEGFRRLEGASAQGVFKLTQAMGGGKTHNLLALGLLAKHPERRADVMGGFYTPNANLGAVRVVAFSGRESDAPLGIWGAIAEQLGKRDQFNDYYAPLAAPGLTAWVNLLQGEPLVIMLDELPPYFVNAAARSQHASERWWLAHPGGETGHVTRSAGFERSQGSRERPRPLLVSVLERAQSEARCSRRLPTSGYLNSSTTARVRRLLLVAPLEVHVQRGADVLRQSDHGVGGGVGVHALVGRPACGRCT